jgi:hypothetical protein
MKNPLYQRILAIILMCLPGVVSVYGWTLMRDILFDTAAGTPFATIQFVIGLLLFIAGIAIIGGFIFYRDKKNNRIKKKR